MAASWWPLLPLLVTVISGSGTEALRPHKEITGNCTTNKNICNSFYTLGETNASNMCDQFVETLVCISYHTNLFPPSP